MTNSLLLSPNLCAQQHLNFPVTLQDTNILSSHLPKLHSTYSRCYRFAYKIQPISPYEKLHLCGGKINRTSGRTSYYSKLKPLKSVAWPVLAYMEDVTQNHTIDLCYVATTLYTDSDVNTSKPLLPQEEDRFKQLENKTQRKFTCDQKQQGSELVVCLPDMSLFNVLKNTDLILEAHNSM